MVKVTTAVQINQIDMLFQKLRSSGMYKKSGIEWPVRVFQALNGKYTFYYPEAYFKNIVWSNRVYVNARTKKDRVSILKWLVDQYAKGLIDVYFFHTGMYLVYNSGSNSLLLEDMEHIGSRRAEVVRSLPRFLLMNNDEFLVHMWSELGSFFPYSIGTDYHCNPSLTNVRMLFKPEIFNLHSGLDIHAAEWVEPISGARDYQHRWISDPMDIDEQPSGMLEGPITLGYPGQGNTRHYVDDQSLYFGCYIEIRFGNGWIPGRYEWVSPDPIIRVVSSSGEYVVIEEQHLVRIKKSL